MRRRCPPCPIVHPLYPLGQCRWGGWAVATVAWVLHLIVSYSVVEWYCRRGGDIEPERVTLALNGLTLITALMAAAGIWLAWHNLRRVRQAGEDGRSRARFMAVSGILISTFFLVVILVEGIPPLVLGPCQ